MPIRRRNTKLYRIGREAELNFGVYAKVLVGREVNSGEKVEII